MYKYAKINLLKAALLLHTVKADTNRLDLALELQRHLVRCIVRTELRIQRLRRKRKACKPASTERLSRIKAEALKAKANALREREEQLSHLLFLWRCFGDGIAFVYQCKYNLKHLYYDHQYQVKEPAGFLSEHGRLKRGFAREYRILCSGIRHDVPVVLSDVTNIVRYGDVCALGGAYPLPIEVKTSSNRNARTARQAKHRAALEDFYANDGAPEFRGVQNVRRVPLATKEIHYQLDANECIRTALDTGWCSASPEPGITYLACTSMDEAKFEALSTGRSTLCVLLSAQPNHLPSYPFTLSLTPSNCIAFMQQQIGNFVFIDLAKVKAAFARQGIYATILMDGTFAIQITRTPDNLHLGVYRISELLFMRIATEFLSIEWFACEYSKVFDEPEQQMTKEELDVLPGHLREVPPDWHGLVDCYEFGREKKPS